MFDENYVGQVYCPNWIPTTVQRLTLRHRGRKHRHNREDREDRVELLGESLPRSVTKLALWNFVLLYPGDASTVTHLELHRCVLENGYHRWSENLTHVVLDDCEISGDIPFPETLEVLMLKNMTHVSCVQLGPVHDGIRKLIADKSRMKVDTWPESVVLKNYSTLAELGSWIIAPDPPHLYSYPPPRD